MPQLRNPRRERFAFLYVSLGKAAQAYLKAGFKAKDADVAGPRLLGYVGIQKRVGRNPSRK